MSAHHPGRDDDALLEPFAAQLRTLYRLIEGRSDLELAALERACAAADSTSEWARYRAAQTMLPAILEEKQRRWQRRARAVASARTATPNGAAP